MERIPNPLVKIYAASSISDMLGSHDQVAQDDIESLSRSSSSFAKASYGLNVKTEQVGAWLLRKTYKPTASALVFIPVVRHFPEQDTSTDKYKITIQDPTASCEVGLPTDSTRWFLREPISLSIFKALGCNLPIDNIKGLSWCSDVLLLANFTFLQDKFTLLHINNRLSPSFDKESLLAMTRKLVTVGLRV